MQHIQEIHRALIDFSTTACINGIACIRIIIFICIRIIIFITVFLEES